MGGVRRGWTANAISTGCARTRRQVAHIVEALGEYRAYGCRPEDLTGGLAACAIDAEISEGVLRLVAKSDTRFDDSTDVFALPVIDEEGGSAYFDLLDAIAAARIRKLNATHRYVRNCTEEEMNEELAALDTDRFFSAEAIHPFDEISEILEWSPAE